MYNITKNTDYLQYLIEKDLLLMGYFDKIKYKETAELYDFRGELSQEFRYKILNGNSCSYVIGNGPIKTTYFDEEVSVCIPITASSEIILNTIYKFAKVFLGKGKFKFQFLKLLSRHEGEWEKRVHLKYYKGKFTWDNNLRKGQLYLPGFHAFEQKEILKYDLNEFFPNVFGVGYKIYDPGLKKLIKLSDRSSNYRLSSVAHMSKLIKSSILISEMPLEMLVNLDYAFRRQNGLTYDLFELKNYYSTNVVERLSLSEPFTLLEENSESSSSFDMDEFLNFETEFDLELLQDDEQDILMSNLPELMDFELMTENVDNPNRILSAMIVNNFGSEILLYNVNTGIKIVKEMIILGYICQYYLSEYNEGKFELIHYSLNKNDLEIKIDYSDKIVEFNRALPGLSLVYSLRNNLLNQLRTLIIYYFKMNPESVAIRMNMGDKSWLINRDNMEPLELVDFLKPTSMNFEPNSFSVETYRVIDNFLSKMYNKKFNVRLDEMSVLFGKTDVEDF
jgi:hypothetical protein